MHAFAVAAGGDYNPTHGTPPSCGTYVVQVLDGVIATPFTVISAAVVDDYNGNHQAANLVGLVTIPIAVVFLASTVYGVYANHRCHVELDAAAR